MKNVCRIALAMTLISVLSMAQSIEGRDVTKTIKAYYNPVMDYCHLIGASLSEKGILDMTFGLDYDGIVLANSYGWSLSSICYDIALRITFENARKIVSQLADISRMRVYIAEFEDQRDKYGNKIGSEKRILCRLELSRETIQRLNWQYVNKELKQARIEYALLVQMLDDSYFDPDHFDKILVKAPDSQ